MPDSSCKRALWHRAKLLAKNAPGVPDAAKLGCYLGGPAFHAHVKATLFNETVDPFHASQPALVI